MIGYYVALIKRELWEHRSIFITPIAIASIVTLGTLMALMFSGEFQHELDLAIFGAQNVPGVAGVVGRRAFLTAFFSGTSSLFLFGLGILTIFYALDSLYAERKDKSILFWRSLPVTDAETVISKLLTAMIAIPAVAIAGIILTHLVNLVITSIWVASQGADAGVLIWGSVPIFDNWMATILVIYAGTIWMSPFLGWLLFVSVWTKRAPFMVAFLPLVLITLLEGIFLRSAHFADAVWARGPKIPLFQAGIDAESYFDEESIHLSEEMVSLLNHIDLGRFFSDIDTWIGLIVCGLLTTAAIYVRRFRDES